MKLRQMPRPVSGSTIVTREESARFKAFVKRVGWRTASLRLDCARTTLEAACDHGSIATVRWTRLQEALTIEEARP